MTAEVEEHGGHFESFICPITGDVMEDPVVTIADGHSYERYAIEEWFRRNHRTSPLTGLPLSNLNVVANITLRNTIDEWKAREGTMRSPGCRIASPGEEKRRALKLALDAKEIRLKEIVEDAPNGAGAETDEERESIGYWLRTRTTLTPQLVDEYVRLLEHEGASCMSFLRDAEYSRRDIVELGVRVPHVASIQRAVDSYCGRVGHLTAMARPDGPLTPEPRSAGALAAAIRTVVSCAVVDQNHPLVNAMVVCGIRVDMAAGRVTTFDLLVKTLKLVQNAPGVAVAGLEVVRTLGRDETMRRAFGDAGACEVIVPQMKGHAVDAMVACEGCWAIRNLAIDDNLATILAAYEACQAVVESMRSHPLHRSTQEQAAAAIVNLGGNNRELKRLLATAGATQVLLTTMGNFPTDPEILKQCCWAILTLAVDDEIARRLAEEGACEAVVAAMRACPNERMVLTKACAAIVNLSGGNQNIKAKFGTIGACDEVIKAMRAFPRDGPLQKQVCWAMKNLAGANDPNRKRFAPGLDGVVLAVRNFSAEREVCEQALGALRTLAVDDENAKELGNQGACEVVVTGMRAHPHVAGVQVQGCGSIINLCGNNPENRRRLAVAGAIELVSAALRQHRMDRGVQEQACWAVTSLGVATPENRKRLGDGGACASVAAALRTFATDRTVAEQAVSAVRNLAIEEENTKRLGAEGACEAIVAVMRSFPNEGAFQSKCCAAVVNLAGGNADNKRRLGGAGACEAVIAALRSFSTDVSVCEQGLWAVKNMAVDPENTVRFGNNGICEIIVASFRNFNTDPRVLAQALASAVNVSGGNDENKKRLGNLGACSEIIWAMQAFPADKTVQLQACWAIKNICNNNEENKKRLGPRACELVVIALRAFTQDEGVQREGKAALRNLSNNNTENRAKIESLAYTEHFNR